MPQRRRSAASLALLALPLAGLGLLATACTQPAPQVNVQAPGGTTSGTGVAAEGISVSGTGEVSGAPDTLTITFGISLTRDTVSAAVADNAAVATKMLDAIKAAGVDEKDIKTNNYNVSPSYDYQQGKQVPKGFQVTNSVVVKAHQLDKAGDLIDAVTRAGGNDVQVQGVSFTLEDNKELLAKARDKAYEDAKAKADQFAKLSGRALGPVLAINEATVPQRYNAVAYATDQAVGGAASTPVNPGQVTTNLQVEVRYAFG